MLQSPNMNNTGARETSRTDARLPRTVILLGLVSLLMDMASEMLYPVAPLFMAAIVGAPVVWIGIIEGLAEALSGITKGYFGSLSDAAGKRRIFVTLGYSISALSKPVPGLSATIGAMLGSRLVDRVGKGLRTAPRDALIAGATGPGQRGAAFGFHRAMDTLGAAIGPSLALLYLMARPSDYSTLFLLAFIPAGLAAITTRFVPDRTFQPSIKKGGLGKTLSYWKEAPPAYKRLLVLLTLFAAVNSSDVFLILRVAAPHGSSVTAITGAAKGFTDAHLTAILTYIVYNIVYALASYPLGRLSDKLGRKPVLSAGLLLFAVVYAGFALTQGTAVMIVLFALYGVYAAMTESVGKAWVGDLIPDHARGRAIGLLTALGSLAGMLASFWTGALWDLSAGTAPLLVSAGLSAVIGLALLTRGPGNETGHQVQP